MAVKLPCPVCGKRIKLADYTGDGPISALAGHLVARHAYNKHKALEVAEREINVMEARGMIETPAQDAPVRPQEA